MYYRLRQMVSLGRPTTRTSHFALYRPCRQFVGELSQPQKPRLWLGAVPVFTKEESELQLEIYSQLGQLISRLDGQLNGGQNWVQLDVAELPSGTYRVRVRSVDYFTKTLIVQ
ncbi:MAG: T9SS type A sorting domain-containing protein [Saprospiraceae bacterium]